MSRLLAIVVLLAAVARGDGPMVLWRPDEPVELAAAPGKGALLEAPEVTAAAGRVLLFTCRFRNRGFPPDHYRPGGPSAYLRCRLFAADDRELDAVVSQFTYTDVAAWQPCVLALTMPAAAVRCLPAVHLAGGQDGAALVLADMALRLIEVPAAGGDPVYAAKLTHPTLRARVPDPALIASVHMIDDSTALYFPRAERIAGDLPHGFAGGDLGAAPLPIGFYLARCRLRAAGAATADLASLTVQQGPTPMAATAVARWHPAGADWGYLDVLFLSLGGTYLDFRLYQFPGARFDADCVEVCPVSLPVPAELDLAE